MLRSVDCAFNKSYEIEISKPCRRLISPLLLFALVLFIYALSRSMRWM